MESNSLQEVIRQYITIPAAKNGRGWHSLRCMVCNDHKNKKRGGWNFDKDKVAYHCFNCNAKAVYDPAEGNLSKEMRRILTAYSIPEEEINKLILRSLKAKTPGTKQHAQEKKLVLESKELPLPPHFYLLGSKEKDAWADVAVEYLETRGMKPTDYKFYLSSGGKTAEEKQWKGRLIIPMYRHGKLIFYQGRDLTNSARRLKYLSPSSEKETVMYGYDELERVVETPLYIVEGFFDAFHINGIAVIGNVLTESQLKILKRCHRPKVVIPDRRGDGHKLALQGLEQGWSVSFPDIANCKDVNDAIVKYGKLYVQKSIVENTKTGFLARTMIELLCKKSEKNKPKK
jgi:hypothetical protein